MGAIFDEKTGFVVALALCLCPACGGKAQQSSADAGVGASADAGADARAACGSVPIPQEHRAVAQACPSERGSLGPIDTTTCKNLAGFQCKSDADCTAGKNGRCYLNSDPCLTICSYDQCLTDADCAEGPCVCRPSGSDLVSNVCLPGSNCRTDADCGGCEYCSPSVVLPSQPYCGPTILTYACHTANDECIDPSDCPGTNDYCGYDAGAGRWGCEFCVPFPHP
ncbi:MAG TPA: hypothetical protein VNW92_14780 [Polyangiaceae bacterium]|nr:hypothetical protein [Polyangiaceae bacterium]